MPEGHAVRGFDIPSGSTTFSATDTEQQSLNSRSQLTIEDLKTSKGTFVDGQPIQGQKHVVSAEQTEFTLGKCPDIFRYTSCPPVHPSVYAGAWLMHETQNLLVPCGHDLLVHRPGIEK